MAARRPNTFGLVEQRSDDEPDGLWFPGAALYQGLLHPDASALRERTSRPALFPYTERHLHCVWQDPAWRPTNLRTRSGEVLEVEHPGIWNREAGPDFLGAVLRIGAERRRLAGDVEIHIHPSDWKAHGHGHDPRYTQVRFHVTYFPGASGDLAGLPGAVHIVLNKALAANPAFSFEQLDLSAYPYAARADQPPCALVLQDYVPEEKQQIIRAAGAERLRRKAERIRRWIQEKGEEQTLYEEIMAALGYKHNKPAFRQIARTVPVDALREMADTDPRTAYACLMGVAGLLPADPPRGHDADTVAWLRLLWDRWWRHRNRYDAADTPTCWRLDGVRPANHPARRLMAAAQLFADPVPFPERLRQVAATSPGNEIQAVVDLLQDTYDAHTSTRLSFAGAPRAQPVALIGQARAAAIATNVIVPYLAAIGFPVADGPDALQRLPRESDNGIIKQTAFYLFGRDHAPSLYKDELSRQGLLQIFQDFCLNDRSRCATCPFPDALRSYRQGR